jgi:hypothetical protein
VITRRTSYDARPSAGTVSTAARVARLVSGGDRRRGFVVVGWQVVEQVGDRVERGVHVLDHQVGHSGAGAVHPRAAEQVGVEGGRSGHAGGRLGPVDERRRAGGHDDHVGQPQDERGAAQAGAIDHEHHGHQPGRSRECPGQRPPVVQRRQPGGAVDPHATEHADDGNAGVDADRHRAGDHRGVGLDRRAPEPGDGSVERQPRGVADAGLHGPRAAPADGQARRDRGGGDDRGHRHTGPRISAAL